MKTERRDEERTESKRAFSLSWKDSRGLTHAADACSLNRSRSGLALQSSVEVPVETVIYIAATDTFPGGFGLVRHCTAAASGFMLGLELDENARNRASVGIQEPHDYYDFLQISPAAQAGTIHRVFRYLAGLYHPDNPETGDPERFVLLNRAYHVLSDSERRAAYDAELKRQRGEPSPTFAGIDFMDGVEGELNRRLALLAVLYKKCRSNINDARVTLVELEQQIGFPREYLDFTTWYLRSKKYITKEDNSDFSLTASGVDFVEENYEKIPLLRKLLSAGTSPRFRRQTSDESAGKSHRSRPPLILPISGQLAELTPDIEEAERPGDPSSAGRTRSAAGFN